MHEKLKFYGTTTVSEKGQVVIPSEARDNVKIDKGQKLLVFGIEQDALVLAKPEHMEEMTGRMAKKISQLQSIAKKESK